MEVLRSAAFVPSSARVLRRRCRVTCTVYEPTRHSRAKVLVSNLSASARTLFSPTQNPAQHATTDDKQMLLKLFKQLALLGKIFSVLILLMASLAVVSLARTQAVFVFTVVAAVCGVFALHVVYQHVEFMMCSVAANVLSPPIAPVNRRPKRIFLVRHGESAGNVDRSLYRVQPDNKLELTEKGKRQAFEAGKKLKQEIGDENVLFYVSPYVRTRQTLAEMLEAGSFRDYSVMENPHLREQEFGNFQDPKKFDHYTREREACGWFYHRMPGGESGADLYTRAHLFLETMFKDVDRFSGTDQAVENIVIVTHGLTMRLICMRYFGWSVEYIQQVRPPANAESWKFEKADDVTGYDLATDVSLSRPEADLIAQDPSNAWQTLTERWRKRFFEKKRSPRRA
uniref:Phosphoglycerate mutase (2,3-diphosphoglycerate-dependent) n=2 Tax=Rhodosorus marinus TaxID=101924 RepID=A0A7S3EBG4_9RHOD|mmetsp:Transcript_22914/g.91700  ORF Transcript_22914/g.91700 Transcript_22914/m.91700 type:complete len:398 (+) Transcript_22914:338-1531(+)